MAKDLQRKATDVKVLNDIDDNGSSKDTFTSLPADQEQSAKTSMSLGSSPQEQNSTSSDEPTGSLTPPDDTTETKNDNSCQTEATKFTNKEDEFEHQQDQGKTQPVKRNVSVDVSLVDDSPNSASLNLINSPILSEKSNSKATTPLASPVGMISSWLSGSTEKPPLASSVISSVNDSELSADPKLGSHGTQLAGSLLFPISSNILLEMDDMGYDGGPCSAGATAVLDFVAQILADIIAEHAKAHSTVESILESVPLFVDAESLLVFQGLCLGRVVNFLERKLLRDDDEDNFKRLDKTKWSANLDALCYMIVDRVYMGSFPMPLGVLRTLEFLLSMLQLANKDGRIEEVTPLGKGLLSITRSTRQLEGYIYSILKNTNRMIMYCFLPTYLASIGEDELLSGAGFQTEPGRYPLVKKSSKDGVAIDICTVLQLLIANKRLILCPSNGDKDVICCLLVTLIVLLRDKRLTAQNLAVDLMKYLLLHRRQMFEEMLMLRADQGGQAYDVLSGGFDKLLTGSVSMFFEWFNCSEHVVNRALDQCASIMWHRYITDSYKFPGVRIKGFETRRKRDMGKRSKETVKLDEKHWELMDKRRDSLEEVRNNMSTLLRKIRQDKYGWVLHAESEWQDQQRQLVHERGIFPVRQSFVDSDWQLCPVEGPFRMRKKLERCKFRVHTIQSLLKSGLLLVEDVMVTNEEPESGFSDNGPDDLGSGLNVLSDDVDQKETDGAASGFYEGGDEDIGFRTEPDSIGWNDGASSINEPSLHSAMDLGVGKSSIFSSQITDSIHPRSEVGSPRASSVRTTDLKPGDEKPDSLLFDNGEYLIRPFLEPSEVIKQKYNCERVVGLDKHDGMFIIGELCLYIIENFYIDETGCICEKTSEDEPSVIDQALGVKKDVITGSEFSLRSSSFRGGVGASMRNLVGGRAWAYNGGAWGKEKVCSSSTLPHPWHMWKLDSVHELLKRDYQLRPVAIEIFSMDGCNDLLVFHKKEREEVFKHLITMNLPRNSMYVHFPVCLFICKYLIVRYEFLLCANLPVTMVCT
jgi:WD repeat and FYVE domain-containing protein 3